MKVSGILCAIALAFSMIQVNGTGGGGGGGGSCPQSNPLGFADGCSGAPTGTIQHPNALVVNTVSFLTVTPGSGYTNGTGYVLSFSGGGCTGTPAGTIDVSGGILVNAVVTNKGAGCTSAPTVSLPGGVGGGTGGSVVANVYTVRPSWNVAGVDYAVGYTTAPTKVAGVAAAPACVNPDNVNKIYEIIQDNCTIDGYDFTQNGGWEIHGCNTSSNPIIKNSAFLVGTLGQIPIHLLGNANGCTDAQGATIINNVLDGSGGTTAYGDQGLIVIRGGTTVIKYNWLKFSPSDFIVPGGESVASGITTTVDIEFNVFEQGATQDGCSGASLHPDWIQTTGFGSQYSNLITSFNLVIQTELPCGSGGGGTQGFTDEGNTNGCPGNCPSFGGGNASNNVIIASAPPAGNIGYGINFTPDQMPASSSFTSRYNYIDPSGLGNQTTDALKAVSSGTTCGTCTWFRNNNVNLIGSTPSNWNTDVPG